MDAIARTVQGGDGMRDTISRQAAIDAINHICPVDTEYDCTLLDRVDVRYVLSDLPSAEPKTGKCESCKRSSDYCSTTDEDKTRCPIEEHYALPKDGYCHLYEQI